MSDTVRIRAEGVSKKYCRNLKRSLFYGVQDAVHDFAGSSNESRALRRDEFWAVDNVSFEVKAGECLGLIGRNGAGKTTLLKMLNGLIKPDRGRIEMRGRVGALIALGAGFNPILTGRENVYVNGAVLGMSKREIDAKYDEIVDFAELEKFMDSPVQSYSSGMQVRLGFAIAVAIRPQIMLLDEVLAVGDVNFQAKCFNTLAKFRESGTAFILVSHNLHLISRYCQQVIYIRNSKVVHLGDVAEGLMKLSADLAEAEQKVDAEDLEWSTIRGSGKVRLTQARFLNARGEATQVIDAGDPVTLVIDYQRLDSSVHSTKMDLIIRDREGNVYQGDNVSSKQPFDALEDNGQIAVSFECMPPNVDYLDFFFTILDPKSGEVFDWKRDVRLRVTRQPLHTGRLFLPVTWKLHSTPEVAFVARSIQAE